MKIHQMTATFGRLESATLTLGSGLNIIQAPNEGGKSTWCAFIKAMLYGIPTRERDTKTTLADKNRWQPWSGAPMSGEMSLTWEERPIILRRFLKGSVPFGGCEVVDGNTGAPIPGITGENVGERLIGVGREVFQRSAFVGQSGIPIEGNPELEKRISALVSSGEEDVSYSRVEDQLKTWLRRRKHNKSGLIPGLETQLAELDALLERIRQNARQLDETQQVVQELARQQSVLETEQAAQKARTAWFQRDQYQQAVSELETARKEVLSLEAEARPIPSKEILREAQGNLAYLSTLNANLKLARDQAEAFHAAAQETQNSAENPLFPNMGASLAAQRATEDVASVREHEKAGKGWPCILGAVLGGAVGGLLAYLLLPKGPSTLLQCTLGALVGGLCGLLPLVILGARHRRAAQQLLKQYRAASTEEMLAYAAAYGEKRDAADEAERKYRAVDDSIQDLTTQRDRLHETLLHFAHTFAPTVTDVFGISAAISRALSLGERLATARVKAEGAQRLVSSVPAVTVSQAPAEAPPVSAHTPQQTAAALAAVNGELARVSATLSMAQGERNTLGDAVALAAQRETLTAALHRRQGEHQALSTALEVLEEANSDLQSRFSPALNKRAGELLSALTGGKYTEVTLNRDCEATAREQGSILPRRAITLSRGTVDQLYLAVRLAVCALALPQEDPSPLVLDDALADFDDGRMALAVDTLMALAEKQQILLFTCHSREAGLLENNPIVFVLRLQS